MTARGESVTISPPGQLSHVALFLVLFSGDLNRFLAFRARPFPSGKLIADLESLVTTLTYNNNRHVKLTRKIVVPERKKYQEQKTGPEHNAC